MNREILAAYLDDALSEADTAKIEKDLRDSETLRQQLQQLMKDRDRGEHSVGAIWRRQRLSCASRDQLGSFLLGVLDEGLHDYIQFHLGTIGCAFCLANLADLKSQQEEGSAKVRERRKKYYQSSAGLLQAPDKKKK